MGALNAVAGLGSTARQRLLRAHGMAVLLQLTLRAMLRREGMSEVVRLTLMQARFTGLHALPLVSVIGLFVGVIVVLQAVAMLPGLGGEAVIGKLLVVIILAELSPLLTAFVVAGRSGTAMAIELGYMRILEEVDALQTMGIDPVHFLLVPRLLGTTLSVFCLSVYFDAVALLGGFSVAALGPARKSPVLLLDNLIASIAPADLLAATLKALGFGVAIAVTASWEGLSVSRSMTEVPQATIRTIVTALFYCIALDLLVTLALG